MAVIKNQSTNDSSIVTDTINLSPSYSYSSMDYGAIPSIPTISITDLDLSNISITGGSSNTTTYTLGAAGSHSNAVWTTTAVPSTGINWNQSVIGSVQPSAKISLKGDNADIDINGKSLVEWMEGMEERLNWMQPNTELEKEWDELQELGNRYRELEKQCKEKSEVWKKLKAMPPPPENF